MKYFYFAILILLFYSCSQGPTKVEPIKNEVESNADRVLENSSIFNDGSSKGNKSLEDQPDVHKVKVVEILQTEKYIYLRVSELDQEYWIVTLLQPIDQSSDYFFTGGILKKNFESLELNRVFDELWVVKNFVPAQHGASQMEANPSIEMERMASKEGVIPLKELKENSKKFENKRVKVQGRVTKVNEDIMDMNWIHLNDGTNNDFDFILTTKESIKKGEVIIMEGVFSLNKDFGAGYYYSFILENCKQIQ